MPHSLTEPLVSVVIPCHNAALWIRETLESVRAQDLNGMEVIVVDDGSSDDSAQIVSSEFPWVSLICTDNRGASAARDTGVASSRGRFLQFLDADDLLPPHKLALQIYVLEHTAADVAYGDWQYLVKQPDGGFAAGAPVAREIEGDADVALFTDCWYPIHAYLFRRAIVERVGGFHPELPIIQDARFALDCALHGGQFVYCSGFVTQYRIHSELQNSKRDPVAFNRDVFRNAVDVEQWWRGEGPLTAARERALLHTYQYVARSTYRRDWPTFEAAWRALETIRPGFCPTTPKTLGWVSRVVGYRNAEEIAYQYRSIKRLFLLRPQST